MIVFPNAKINLGLHVVEKRPDDFHNIETIFYPINLCDALEIIPSDKDGIEFNTTGIPVPGDPESNLVLKAINLVSDACYPSPGPSPGASPSPSPGPSPSPSPGPSPSPSPGPSPSGEGRWGGVEIHLHKVIPTGAGLGGGSSDAAFTVKLLNDLWNLNLSVTHMQDLAGQLGSDCAFFIENRPVFATGRGDRFENISLDLSGYRIVIVVPPVHVSTPEAYRMVTPAKPSRSLLEVIRFPVEEWKGVLINDFENPVMSRFPVIREIKEALYDQGAIYASMSGSGAAVYGIFGRQQAASAPRSADLNLPVDPSFVVWEEK